MDRAAIAVVRRPPFDSRRRMHDIAVVAIFVMWTSLIGLSPFMVHGAVKMAAATVVVNWR